MKKNILLTIAYDGTNYAGWQKQSNPAVVTVEGALWQACAALLKTEDFTLVGASRTDAGVHALGQRAALVAKTTIPADRFPFALRPFLPQDIVIVASQEAPAEFHPRYDCVKKTYEYHIWNHPVKNPLTMRYTEWVAVPLSVPDMQAAAALVVGKRDFQAFCASGSQVKSTVRTVMECTVRKEGDSIIIHVGGDGFLYNMVRILAGTLIAVGKGQIPPKAMSEILASKDRVRAGMTARASGLVLKEIVYE